MNTNILPSKAYDILKWVVLVFLPALTTLVGVVGQALSWGNMEIVLTIMVGATTFLGTLLGVSNAQYKASENVINQRERGGKLNDCCEANDRTNENKSDRIIPMG